MVQARIEGRSRRLYLYGGGLTPKLPELIKRTFRGVHLLPYPKREELMQIGRSEDFESAAEDTGTLQHETLGSNDESAESRASDATERPFSPTVSIAHRSLGDNP